MPLEDNKGSPQVNGAAVSVRHLGKTYAGDQGNLEALKDVNLEIGGGEIFGIIGRSGAGKSTLVRCINLLERPSAGEILVGGENISRLDPAGLRAARQKIGMIFQHFNLLTSRTVYDNVALPLEFAGVSRGDIERRVAPLLDLVGLTPYAHNYVAQVSGGQKQRVGIARALASNPRVLLSDEATSALDPETTRATLALLKQVNRELGLTIIMITHQMEVVQRICDRVAVVDGGEVVEQGTVREVFGAPKSEAAQALVAAAVGQVLPEGTVKALLERATPNQRVWRVSGSRPDVLTRFVAQFGLDVKLVQALVDDYQGVPLGSLLVQVTGSDTARAAAREWAQAEHVELVEVAHVE